MKAKVGILALAAVMMAVGAQADNFGTGANQFSIDFVNIGNAGNTADTTGYGAVGYDYRIGQTEVTLDQFAKARAADSRIGNGNEGYWNDGTRTVGTGGPASKTSWFEAAKFANWLTTGDAYNGIYQFDGSGTLTSINRSYRNGSGVAYVLPSEDEWYKAAYYKPIDDGSYSLYSNGSDSADDLTHGTANGWNYYNSGFVSGSPNYAWETGFGGEEQNGTYDMTGNVYEWTEDLYTGLNRSDQHVVRGGAYYVNESGLRSSQRTYFFSTNQNLAHVGFRVAAIPEPSSIAMIGLVSGCAVFVRRRFLI